MRSVSPLQRNLRSPATFIAAFLLYNDAIQTVITLATQYDNQALKIPISQLTLVILMVQFVGIFGALVFKWVAAVTNAKSGVALSLVIWTALLVYIYLAVRTAIQLFATAAVVALVLGGSQALSRSLYAQLIPKLQEAEYYSIYSVASFRMGDQRHHNNGHKVLQEVHDHRRYQASPPEIHCREAKTHNSDSYHSGCALVPVTHGEYPRR